MCSARPPTRSTVFRSTEAPLSPITGTWAAPPSAAYTSTALVALGGFSGNASNPSAVFYFGGIYNRALSANEAAALGMNPWQLFKPRAGMPELATSPAGYTFFGPTRVAAGTASSNFTVTPNGSVTDSLTIASSVVGDLFSSSLIFNESSTAQTFTITPVSGGPRTITLTSSQGYPASGSPWTIEATAPVTLTGPAFLYEGTAGTLTLIPAMATTDTITLSDGGKGGTFSPSNTISWVASSSPKTVTYTAAITGMISLSASRRGWCRGHEQSAQFDFQRGCRGRLRDEVGEAPGLRHE